MMDGSMKVKPSNGVPLQLVVYKTWYYFFMQTSYAYPLNTPYLLDWCKWPDLGLSFIFENLIYF